MSLDNFLGNLYEFEVDMRTYFDDRKALGMLLLLGRHHMNSFNQSIGLEFDFAL